MHEPLGFYITVIGYGRTQISPVLTEFHETYLARIFPAVQACATNAGR